MIYEPSTLAVVVFCAFTAFTLVLSFWLGRKAKSSEGYFAAHGQIPWAINGVAFAGDYLSAASFLGICGMIAFYGYDGFLYSIGFLAGWVVALFVVAEPMKRMGKFTFADALDAKFNSRGIKLAAGISTLAVSVFYLIPQMVGAGVLVQPLLGFPHWVGVVMVGATVILIVVTAGMVSTTWVQFLKGTLLVIFSFVLVCMILAQGFEVSEDQPQTMTVSILNNEVVDSVDSARSLHEITPIVDEDGGETAFFEIRESEGDPARIWKRIGEVDATTVRLIECQTIIVSAAGGRLINGRPDGEIKSMGRLASLDGVPDTDLETGAGKKSDPVGPVEYFSTFGEAEIWVPRSSKVTTDDGRTLTAYYPELKQGSDLLRPGEHPKFAGIRSEDPFKKLNFLSLMLALFCGTASLPHILIRYYTVKDSVAARKSTILGIATIGFFYVLTLYMGLGAMTSGAMDPTNSNMAAPLLAKSISDLLFAIISAIAFTTVLGTVSGLILASAGAVTHDLITAVGGYELSGHQQMRVGKIASVVVGSIAIVLGILFEKLNVGYLVGWAFSVAASANLPSLVMLLFWKKTTKQGIIAAVLVGMISSLSWILLSSDSYKDIYGLNAEDAIVPFTQPGIVTIPLGFLTLIVVSLLTQEKKDA
ncbi:sodium/solute symporter [Stratiformator vulcanicus]|uniref:Cation/acetate symporter ActP n=1 Tax=Stratiformator vulcanicus TaxID=2527980 RepID=A0A517R3W5_9PLAN|nr:cation acetate symporter [Stratiformator vulcanicus]QDT38589.1 Cation/acetate symporter ActP [Stratiformator vulcanicus]